MSQPLRPCLTALLFAIVAAGAVFAARCGPPSRSLKLLKKMAQNQPAGDLSAVFTGNSRYLLAGDLYLDSSGRYSFCRHPAADYSRHYFFGGGILVFIAIFEDKKGVALKESKKFIVGRWWAISLVPGGAGGCSWPFCHLN